MDNWKLTPAVSAAKAEIMERENKIFQKSRKSEYSMTEHIMKVQWLSYLWNLEQIATVFSKAINSCLRLHLLYLLLNLDAKWT